MHRTKHLADRSGDCLLRWDYYEFHKQRLLGATCGTGIVRTETGRQMKEVKVWHGTGDFPAHHIYEDTKDGFMMQVCAWPFVDIHAGLHSHARIDDCSLHQMVSGGGDCTSPASPATPMCMHQSMEYTQRLVDRSFAKMRER
eukprot:COSAG06_NODE_3456_length_5315_cov_3.740414_5_plen_142_part_00